MIIDKQINEKFQSREFWSTNCNKTRYVEAMFTSYISNSINGLWRRYSSVCTVTLLRPGRPRNHCSIPDKCQRLLSTPDHQTGSRSQSVCDHRHSSSVEVRNGKTVACQAWTGPWVYRIPRQSVREGGKAVSHTHRPPLSLRKYLWYSFMLKGWVDPRATVRPEGLGQWKIAKTSSGTESAQFPNLLHHRVRRSSVRMEFNLHWNIYHKYMFCFGMRITNT
jgi:hypothetical protein